MKQEQLLDAIGFVDEDMLMESEITASPRKHTVYRAVLIAAIVTILGISVAATSRFIPIKNAGIRPNKFQSTYYDVHMNEIGSEEHFGYKITMDMDIQKEIPYALNNTYLITPKGWEYERSSYALTNQDLSQYNIIWRRPGYECTMHQADYIFFRQESGRFYNQNTSRAIDIIGHIPEEITITGELKQFDEIKAYMVTIPSFHDPDRNEYMANGEKRLYFSDGENVFQLRVPAPMTDREIGEILDSMHVTDIQEFWESNQ